MGDVKYLPNDVAEWALVVRLPSEQSIGIRLCLPYSADTEAELDQAWDKVKDELRRAGYLRARP